MNVLRAAIGATPQTRALLDGRIASDLLRLEFASFPTINRAFAPMVRELRFDVSELAIATYFQARAAGIGIVLLPAVLAERFQEQALLCRRDGAIAGPADLIGRRVGIRAYGQTTGMWLRGTLAEQFGVAPDRIDWITFEGAHVPGLTDPPWATRAPDGADMLTMLQAGGLDAAIFGTELPSNAGLRTVIPDPAAAAAAFHARHGFTPVNHVLTAKRSLAETRPDLMAELLRMLAASQAGTPKLPSGRAALQPALELALHYTAEQGLLPAPLNVRDLWDGSPAELEAVP